jgi:hypothetical protein
MHEQSRSNRRGSFACGRLERGFPERLLSGFGATRDRYAVA